MVGLRDCFLLVTILALPLSVPAQTIKPPPEKPATQAKSDAKAPAPGSNTLFEGYSKVLLGGVHVGFVVQRYEFDPKKKEFVSTYFLKTNSLAGGVTESLKARATIGFKPVNYQYTELVGGKSRTIDATFSKDVMTALVKDGDKTSTIRKNIPKGAFPSTFLVYMMLAGKEGIKPGVRYGFVAIAEEDAGVYPGEAYVASQDNINGMAAFKVFNTFKGTRFASYVNAKGDVLATKSPVQSIATELVGSMQEATSGQSFSTAPLTVLFGNIPQGKQNAINRKEPNPAPVEPVTGDPLVDKPILSAGSEESVPAAPVENSAPVATETAPPAKPRNKGGEIPGGKGVMLKGDGKSQGQ